MKWAKRSALLIKENTFSSRVKLLREPWCETSRSAGRAIIRILASLIKGDSRDHVLHRPFSFLYADGQQSDLCRARIAFR